MTDELVGPWYDDGGRLLLRRVRHPQETWSQDKWWMSHASSNANFYQNEAMMNLDTKRQEEEEKFDCSSVAKTDGIQGETIHAHKDRSVELYRSWLENKREEIKIGPGLHRTCTETWSCDDWLKFFARIRTWFRNVMINNTGDRFPYKELG